MADKELVTLTADDVGTLDVGTLAAEAAAGTGPKAPRLQAIYDELKAEEIRLEALLEPARAYYEKHVNDPQLLKAKQIIREVNLQLGPIKNELAILARMAPANKGIAVEPGEFSARVNN